MVVFEDRNGRSYDVPFESLPPEVVEQYLDELVERECTTCGETVLDAPDNDEPVTCEDH